VIFRDSRRTQSATASVDVTGQGVVSQARTFTRTSVHSLGLAQAAEVMRSDALASIVNLGREH